MYFSIKAYDSVQTASIHFSFSSEALAAVTVGISGAKFIFGTSSHLSDGLRLYWGQIGVEEKGQMHFKANDERITRYWGWL